MDAQTLARLFEWNYKALKKNLEGITHEESLRPPAPGGNCLNWVVGHIVSSRNSVLGLLDEAPVLNAEAAARYSRGSAPITSSDESVPLSELLANFDRSQERLRETLERKSAGAGSIPPEAWEKLATLHFHEAYHTGQTGILRRLLGKESAIR